MVGNNIDIGMWGNTPIIRAHRGRAADQPDGGRRRAPALRDRDPQGLADPHHRRTSRARRSARSSAATPTTRSPQMLRYELGSADPKAYGITARQHADAGACRRRCRPAWTPRSLIYPAFLAAQKRLGTVGIMNSFGYTEDHYNGPAGKGAGHPAALGEEVALLPGRLLSPPLVLDRAQRLVEQHPKVVVAFLMRAAGSGRGARHDGPGRGVAARQGLLEARPRSRARRWSRTRSCSSAAGPGRPRTTPGPFWRCRSSWCESKVIEQPLTWAQVRERSRQGRAAAEAGLRTPRRAAARRRVHAHGRRRPCAACPSGRGTSGRRAVG